MENTNIDKPFKVALLEFERGWGSKIDEIKGFDTKEEADTFIKEFNSYNTSETVPDWYMIAQLTRRILYCVGCRSK